MFGVRFRLQALLVGIALACVHATKPDGYVAPPRQPDPHPPKYEYGYAVGSSDGGDSIATNGTRSNAGQGHREFRDGDNTHGNYYVNFADGEAQQSVQYIADDWGYHPVVRYVGVCVCVCGRILWEFSYWCTLTVCLRREKGEYCVDNPNWSVLTSGSQYLVQTI